MEATNENQTKNQTGKGMLWTGRVISTLCVLFFLFDGIMKVFKSAPAMEGSLQLGWPAEDVQAIGIVLILCTILYIIPVTNILGAILLTGYLGGATSIMVRAMMPGHPYLFPVFFGVLVWAGLYFRDSRVRNLIPLHGE